MSRRAQALGLFRLAGSVASVLALGCGTAPCPFSARCDGGILETCVHGAGLVATRITQTDCSQQNAQCVETDAGDAACFPLPCPANFLDHCAGDILIYCDPTSNTVQSVDCYDPYYDVGHCSDFGNGQAQCVTP